MIWLLAQPLTSPFPVNKFHILLSLPVCRRSSLLILTGGGVGGRGLGANSD
jgi:hypothetical protein